MKKNHPEGDHCLVLSRYETIQKCGRPKLLFGFRGLGKNSGSREVMRSFFLDDPKLFQFIEAFGIRSIDEAELDLILGLQVRAILRLAPNQKFINLVRVLEVNGGDTLISTLNSQSGD